MLRLTCTIHRYFANISRNILQSLQIKNDKYNAIHITPKEEIEGRAFKQYMTDLLKNSLINGTTSIWVHLSGRQLALVSDLVNDHGFNFHRGGDKSISLYRWILPARKDMVVPYSMFHVGCGGVIIDDSRILLIQEKRGELKGRYGVPGGRADFGESLQQCSQREVFEQIGVKSTFSNILWLRQLSSYVYGSYDFYFACLMQATPAALKQLKVCDYQIQKAVWIPLNEYKTFAQANSFGTQLQLALYVHDLYEQGFDFSNPTPNYAYKRYVSQVDQKERFFAHHRLAKK